MKIRIFQAIPDAPFNEGEACEGHVLMLDPGARNKHSVELNPRMDLRAGNCHRFAWGGPTEGAIQLAVALLAEVGGGDIAMRYFHDFKEDVIQRKTGMWSVSEEFILGWISGRTRRTWLDGLLGGPGQYIDLPDRVTKL